MEAYIKRISDEKLQLYLTLFGAVLVEGPKWCGKTESSKQYTKSNFEIADPRNNFANRTIAQLNPEEALGGVRPRLIDEWQEVPTLWDAVRYKVDQNAMKGQYILTGSSTPNDTATIHSGAGRIGRLKMSTMTLQELGISKQKVSLNELLYGQVQELAAVAGGLDMTGVINLICRGGWPGLVGIDTTQAMRVIRDYVKTLTHEDISQIDGVKRDPAKVAALLQSMARNTASLVSRETIRKDIEQYDAQELHAKTVGEYMALLSRMFVLNEIPAWNPALKSTVRLRSAPKRLLVDASIAVAALRATPEALQQDPKFVGNLFETLVLHDLAVYADAIDAELYHYNDNSLEVDAIIEGNDKNWGAIEIKLGYTGEDAAASSLLRLVGKIEQERQKAPKFLAVIVGIGGILRQREDGVWVIPVDTLGV